MPEMISQNKRSKVYLELMRIVAIVMIVFCHTKAYLGGVGLGLGEPAGWIHAVECLLSRTAVPLFFMISGALLLGRREDIGQVWKKRVLRMALAIAFVWLLQYAYVCFLGEAEFGVRTYVAAVLGGKNCIISSSRFAVVWYLYVYLFLMMLLPLLRVLAQGMRNRHYIYLLVFQVVTCGLVPFVYACATGSYYVFSCPLAIPNSVQYGAFFMLMGYFVETRCARTLSLPRPILLMLSAIVFCTICSVILFQGYLHDGADVMVRWTGTASLSTIPAMGLYVVLRQGVNKINPDHKLRKVLAALGGSVFFVMLTENIWRECFSPWFPIDDWCLAADVVAWCQACCVVLCGMAVGVLLKLLPGFQRIL